MFTSHQLSDWILSTVDLEAGDTISPLKLQKLLYYCQAWHYTIFEQPLFDERIEAWTHGPVIPSQFARFASTTRHAQIDIETMDLVKVEIEEKSLELLKEVIAIYGEHSAGYLEDLTHQEQPWILARIGVAAHERSNKEITLESMKNYYSSLKKNGE